MSKSSGWEWIGRMANSLSLIQWILPVVGAFVTGALNWFGIPLWQAAIVSLCFVAVLVLSIWLGRWVKKSSPLNSESLSQDSVSLVPSSEHARSVQVLKIVLLVMFLVYFVYLHSLLYGIRRSLDCYVTPRVLTSDQVSTIATSLKKHEPHDITLLVQVRDEEASRYASDFRRALIEGNWRIASYEPRENLSPGTELNARSNEQIRKADQQRRSSDPRNPEEILYGALVVIHKLDRSGYSLDKNLTDADYYKVSLTVGPRPYRIGCEEKEE